MWGVQVAGIEYKIRYWTEHGIEYYDDYDEYYDDSALMISKIFEEFSLQ